MTADIPLFPLSAVRDPGCKEASVERNGATVAIFVVRRDGKVFAYENTCPHLGVPLNWKPDSFLTNDQTALQCSLHRAVFRIEDGYCLEGPCASRSLTAVPVRIDRGQVMLIQPVP